MDKQKVAILDAQVDGLDMQGAIDFVAKTIAEARNAGLQAAKPKHIITLNAEIIYRAQSEPELLEIINQADLVTPDGAGVVWAAQYLGTPVPGRVTGIDLLQEVVREADQKGWQLFFFGGAPGVADKAVENLKKKYKNIKIVGTKHGYISSKEEEKELTEKIKNAAPDIIFVALGAPRQEYWIKKHKDFLQVPVCIGVGGSFDVIAGKVTRAPGWMQQAKLEWLYRLVKEPARYKRMLALPKFMLKVIQSKK
ncbi:MAG: WecB/TagA/CpsF family glycosyltransferase [Clostridia bacterium]|nr:WecB/TagA/CpsF family glycosyltransferase [Clostridia bacterium]